MHFRVGELAAAAAVAAADRPTCRRVPTEAGSSRSVREARGSQVSAVAAAARCPCRVRPRGPPTVAVRFVYGLPGGLGLRRAGRGSVRRTDGAEASSGIPGRPGGPWAWCRPPVWSCGNLDWCTTLFSVLMVFALASTI